MPTYLNTILATPLYFSGDPTAVGEDVDGVLLIPTDANEIVLDASSGSDYILFVLSDGSAAAAGVIVGDTYKGHLGITELTDGVNELMPIETFIGLDGIALSSPPIMLSVYAGVEAVAGSGNLHSIFIDMDGNAYASGNNDKGQLCLGNADSRASPTQIDLPSPAVSAAVGADFTYILTEDGIVHGCGSNEVGQLGLGSSIDASLLPNDGNGLTDVLSVSAGLNFALFRTSDGVFVTGDNTYGQLCVDGETELFSPR